MPASVRVGQTRTRNKRKRREAFSNGGCIAHLLKGTLEVRAASWVHSSSDGCNHGVAWIPLGYRTSKSESEHVETRKMVNYARGGRSQGKPWWKLAAILTCKSFVRPWYRGERPIEPSSSWFPPKFPSGLLRPPTQLQLVKRMIRSLRSETTLDLFSNFKRV